MSPLTHSPPFSLGFGQSDPLGYDPLGSRFTRWVCPMMAGFTDPLGAFDPLGDVNH